jgi:molybdopterin-containing oxidoreductase family iron-sulfur binding subunit
MSMLIDLTRCIGCDACTVACKQENGTPADVFFARVLNVEAGTYPDVKRVYLPLLCNHCENPACLKACPNKAIFRRDDGIVLIDQDRCKGTGACVSACPYGNVILTEKDNWYLPEDEPYEKDFVKPRIKENKARKCTLCAHRVDEGLEPACVVACPTTARIFGDLDDPDSKISKYVVEQEVETKREPFKLLPEAGTQPATLYLGTMAAQESSTLGNAGEPPVATTAAHDTPITATSPKMPPPTTSPSDEHQTGQPQPAPPEVPNPGDEYANAVAARGQSAPVRVFGVLADLMRNAGKAAGVLLLGAVLAASTSAQAQNGKKYVPLEKPSAGAAKSVAAPAQWDKSCAVCHGAKAQGGIGPALAHNALPFEQYQKIVREGKGAMPPFAPSQISDQELKNLYDFTKAVQAEPAGSTPAAPLPAGAPTKVDVPAVWSSSSCAACHGPDAMGGLGPPLAGTTLPFEQYEHVVRNGKGMMPAVSKKDVSDAELKKIYAFNQSAELSPDQIPIAFKIGKLLSTRNVGLFFMVVTLISVLLALKVLWYWIDCAGWKQIKPYLKKFGYLRATGIVISSLILDGLFVRSLWRTNKHRWAMHALLIYGFIGLSLADFLMQMYNPTRAEVALTHPIKILANLSGFAVLLGIIYVRIRYATDKYIDNGLTLGRDYLFINLLALSIITGFIVEGLGYAGESHWVQPLYMLHLAIIAILFLSAPFTRFNHVFVVPALVAMTRVGEAIAQSGVEIGFLREPSPGRHHKSERIAEQVLKHMDPNFKGPITLRYYP